MDAASDADRHDSSDGTSARGSGAQAEPAERTISAPELAETGERGKRPPAGPKWGSGGLELALGAQPVAELV